MKNDYATQQPKYELYIHVNDIQTKSVVYYISGFKLSHFFRNLRTLVGACARNPSVFSLEKNGLFSTYILLEKLLFATDLSEVNFLDRDHQIYLH